MFSNSYTKYFSSNLQTLMTQKGEKYIHPVLPVICESQASIYLELLNQIQQSILIEIDIIHKKCLNSEKAKLERLDLLNEIIKYMLEDEENAQKSLYKPILDIALNVLNDMKKM